MMEAHDAEVPSGQSQELNMSVYIMESEYCNVGQTRPIARFGFNVVEQTV
jgi:hypothetical protein